VLKILYFHHADKLGGAPLSLLYLVERLDRSRFQPVICCLQEGEVLAYYGRCGIETIVRQDITTFGHTTGGWYPLSNPLSLWRLCWQIIRFPLSVWRTYRLLRVQRPALVHLNSLTLVPSAVGARLAGVPLVWHVREAVHNGHLGVRKRLLSWLVGTLPDEVIYISKDYQRRMAMRRRGLVIYNFVDFQRFDRNLDGTVVRERLGIPRTASVALFLGGVSLIKGVMPLSLAIPHVRERVPGFICLVAGRTQIGRAYSLGSLWRRLRAQVGRPAEIQKAQASLSALAAEGMVHLVGFRTDVEQLIAASDVVLFPSTVPHFPRPVIEAGAMAKAVGASRIGGVEEVVEHERTGLLVPPNDPESLATSIVSILTDRSLAARLGEAGYRQARRLFDARRNVAQTIEVYERLLGESP
jgi:glycosyltransferase involved in cell wall biosynthesis